MCRYVCYLVLIGVSFLTTCGQAANAESSSETYDVVIYGGTSAAVTAAVQVKRMGKTVAIVCPDKHLGGLSSGGLGWTDTGKKEVIGGLARDFYHRIFMEYQEADAWKWQTQESYGGKGQGNKAIDGENRTQWIFEPHVAEKVFDDYVTEFEIPVHRDRWLDRETGVELAERKIRSIKMLSGEVYRASVFMDATYEGDLIAAAGVSYHVGRESGETYGEKWAGVQTGVLHHHHHFGGLPPISPYRVPGDTSSGVLPRISAVPPGEKGAGDKKVQAYCFRMCLSNHPDNRISFTKPVGYDADQYELLARIYAAGWDATFRKYDPIPNRKTDTNNHGPMSTDNIGMNYDYPDASYQRRREIIAEHETYQKGWLYFVANDTRVPKAVREEMNTWGLAADEFVDNGHWPHQLYIREARRMVGQYVMTENELQKRRPTPMSVGMGSYSIDSHNIQRYITPEGHVQNEGDIGVSTGGPYEIAYGALVPQKSECKNLIVPVCVSSSHIAFGSIRMEPVFMILGQSAATAAVMAIDQSIPVQEVPYDQLRERLLQDGQVLQTQNSKNGVRSGKGLDPQQLSGIVLDDDDSIKSGFWTHSTANAPFVGEGYSHDRNKRDGSCVATYSVKLQAGRYSVQVAYPVNSNRASNVPVTIVHADGTDQKVVNQRSKPGLDGVFESLGHFNFSDGQPATVTISNQGVNGYVVVDAVRFVPLK